MTIHNHSFTILKVMYDTGKKLTASDFIISNANQYLVTLERNNLIERKTVSKEHGNTTYKIGYVSSRTRKKARKYLIEHNMLNSKTPLNILNIDLQKGGS